MTSDRREFLKQVSAFAVGAALIPPVWELPLVPGDPVKGPRAKVVRKTGDNYQASVDACIAGLGGMGNFVKPGAKVVVKPNIGWDRSPEQAANTHPTVVAAIVAQALAAGAKQVLVFDRTCNNAQKCYAHSGIEGAVKALGNPKAKVVHMDRRKWTPVDIKDARSVDRWDFYRDALEADCYINVPVAKHHGLTRLSLGLKNVMGVIGGNRGSLHKGISEKLADINSVLPAHLTIIDASRILLRHGPQGGSLDDVKVTNTILASVDQVAVDAVACGLFGLQPNDVELIPVAAKRGLGVGDLSRIDVVDV